MVNYLQPATPRMFRDGLWRAVDYGQDLFNVDVQHLSTAFEFSIETPGVVERIALNTQ